VELGLTARDKGRVVSDRSGVLEQYAWDRPTGTLRQLTDRPFGTFWATISPAGRFVFFLDDLAGNETGHLARVPCAGGAAADLTPGWPAYALAGIALDASGDRLAITVADGAGSRILAFENASKEAVASPRVLTEGRFTRTVEAISTGANLVVCSSAGATGEIHLEALDWGTGSVVAALADGPEADLRAVMASPLHADSRLLATSTRSGFRRPLFWDPVSGQRDDLQLDDLDGEVVPLDWASDGDRVLLMRTVRAIQELYIHEPTTGTTRRLRPPSGTLGSWGGGIGFGPERDLIAVWQDATTPPQLIALDDRTGHRRDVLIPASPVPHSQPWRSVHFRSVDGAEIQGWLATPAGSPPFPAIIHAHGGPEGCLTEVFEAESQTWVDQGFAFLTINYRGSTTFGREFEQKIYGNPGYWEVEDLAAGREWLVAEGIARPDEVFVAGTSYGGFLALQALGTRPELWVGGMAISPVADWFAQVEDASGPARDWAYRLLGGDPESRNEQYVSSSPISYIDAVRAAVLIIAGRQDSTVPPRGVQRYESRMQATNGLIEVRWFDGGHFTITRPDLLILHQEWMLEFAGRVLNDHGFATIRR